LSQLSSGTGRVLRIGAVKLKKKKEKGIRADAGKEASRKGEKIEGITTNWTRDSPLRGKGGKSSLGKIRKKKEKERESPSGIGAREKKGPRQTIKERLWIYENGRKGGCTLSKRRRKRLNLNLRCARTKNPRERLTSTSERRRGRKGRPGPGELKRWKNISVSKKEKGRGNKW